MTLHWTEADGVLTCRDGDAVVFRDTADHWTNAVCRLLGLSDEQGRAWVAHVAAAARGTYGRSLAALDGHDTIEALAAGSRAAFPVPAGHVDPPLPVTPGTCGHAPGRFWSTWMSEAAGFAIAGCGRCDHGWLVDLRRADQKLVETVAYDQAYFEGAEHGLGYGNYLQQQGWRLEKARRLLRQVSAACLYGNVAPPDDRRALDVGSGYGVFRKALD
ncbi:MAG TPA: hypothetical protein VK324_16310, partial [Tepidisphaeraceae bacterium]|nr:hypothetical protein [Tepidisphaeraceae bacterium]